MSEELICTKCGKKKDISEFGKCSHNKSGLNGQCKKCKNAYNNERRHRPKIEAKAKPCRRCGKKKDASDYSKDISYKDGLSLYCKSCRVEKKIRKNREQPMIKNGEYRGEMIHKWEESHMHQYVITGMQAGSSTNNTMIGKVAQVRLEAGQFGSNLVFLRHCDDVLMTHHNQCFWLVPDRFKEYLDDCFIGCYIDKADREEYTIGKEHGRTGFIIPSEVKEGESTPMRDVKSAIDESLNKLIKDN